MFKVLTGVAVFGTILISACRGQALSEALSFERGNSEGFHIYGVSTTFSYSSFNFPQNSSQNGLVTADSDMRYGVTGTVGWQRLHGRGNFSARYSGSYNADLQQSNLNSLNHNLMLGFNRKL